MRVLLSRTRRKRPVPPTPHIRRRYALNNIFFFFSIPAIIRKNEYRRSAQCTKLDGGGDPAGRSPDFKKITYNNTRNGGGLNTYIGACVCMYEYECVCVCVCM